MFKYRFRETTFFDTCQHKPNHPSSCFRLFPQLTFCTPPTSVEGDIVGVPDEFALFQNYPNPFNPETKIVYHVAEAGHVSIGIYNIVGQKVRTLVSTEQQANSYTVQWDGKNDSGLQVPTGMYFYRLRATGFTQSKRMLLLR